jgi:hypothetical protein
MDGRKEAVKGKETPNTGWSLFYPHQRSSGKNLLRDIRMRGWVKVWLDRTPDGKTPGPPFTRESYEIHLFKLEVNRNDRVFGLNKPVNQHY